MLLPLLVACGGAPKDTGPVDDGEPRIFITAPDADADVIGCFDLGVEIWNFTLVSPVDENAPVEGHGHYHVVFEARYFDCELEACELSLAGFEAGEVPVTVRLVGNDHADVPDDAGAPIEDTRSVTFTGEACPLPED